MGPETERVADGVGVGSACLLTELLGQQRGALQFRTAIHAGIDEPDARGPRGSAAPGANPPESGGQQTADDAARYRSAGDGQRESTVLVGDQPRLREPTGLVLVERLDQAAGDALG